MNVLLNGGSGMLLALHRASVKPLVDTWLSAYCATFFEYGLGYYSAAYNSCLPLVPM